MAAILDFGPELGRIRLGNDVTPEQAREIMATRGDEIRRNLIAERMAKLELQTEIAQDRKDAEEGIGPMERAADFAMGIGRSAVEGTGKAMRAAGRMLSQSPVSFGGGPGTYVPPEVAEREITENLRRMKRTPQERKAEFLAEPVTQAGTKVEEFAAEEMPVIPGREGTLPTMVGEGVGSVVGLAPALATGPMAPVTGALLYGGTAAESAAQDAGRTIRNQIAAALSVGDMEKAAALERERFSTENLAAAVTAPIGALTEAGLGVGPKVLGRIVGNKAAAGLSVRLAEKLATKMPARVASRVAGAGEGFVREASQEGLEQLLSNTAARMVYDPDRDITEGLAESMVVGGLTGKLVGGVMGVDMEAAQDRAMNGDIPGVPLPNATKEVLQTKPAPAPEPDEDADVAATDIKSKRQAAIDEAMKLAEESRIAATGEQPGELSIDEQGKVTKAPTETAATTTTTTPDAVQKQGADEGVLRTEAAKPPEQLGLPEVDKGGGTTQGAGTEAEAEAVTPPVPQGATAITPEMYRAELKKSGDNMAAVDEKLAKTVRETISAGGKVTLVVDGKPVEIVGIAGGMLLDNKGQRWGMMSLATGKDAKKNRIVFEPPAPAPSPAPAPAPAPAPTAPAITEAEQAEMDRLETVTEMGSATPKQEARLAELKAKAAPAPAPAPAPEPEAPKPQAKKVLKAPDGTDYTTGREPIYYNGKTQEVDYVESHGRKTYIIQGEGKWWPLELTDDGEYQPASRGGGFTRKGDMVLEAIDTNKEWLENTRKLEAEAETQAQDKEREDFVETVDDAATNLADVSRLRALVRRAVRKGYITEADGTEIMRIQRDVGSRDDTSDAFDEFRSLLSNRKPTPAPAPAEAKPRPVREVAAEFDKVLEDAAIELGWVEDIDALTTPKMPKGAKQDAISISAKIARSKETAKMRNYALDLMGESKTKAMTPTRKAELLPKLKALVEKERASNSMLTITEPDKRRPLGVPANELAVGDELGMPDGKSAKVTDIDPDTGDVGITSASGIVVNVPEGSTVYVVSRKAAEQSAEFAPEGEAAPTPKLAAGVNQGDLIDSTQREDFALVGEEGTDAAKAQAEKEAAAKAKEEARALQEKQQLGLFTSEESQAKADELTNASSPLQQKGKAALDFLNKLEKKLDQPFMFSAVDPTSAAALMLAKPLARLAIQFAKALVGAGMRLEAAIRQGIEQAREQMPDEQVDEEKLAEAMYDEVASFALVEPSPATPEARGKTKGVIKGKDEGLYVKESDEGWARRAKAFVDKWPDLPTALKETINIEEAMNGLTDAVRKYALNEIMSRAVALLKAQNNPAEMAMARAVIEKAADALKSIASDAGATLSASNLSQQRYGYMYPVLSLFDLINKQHRKLAFPELTDNVLREWALDTKAKAIRETKKNLSAANAIVAREFKIAADELGLIWGEIFRASLKKQDATKRKIMEQILRHPKLKNLSDEGIAELSNLLGREWAKAHKAVYRAEFAKLIKLPKISEKKRLKMMNALPRIITLANVGVLDNAAFRNAIAPEFGMQTFDGELAKRVMQMSQEAQEVTGTRRNQLVERIYHEMLKAGGIRPGAILSDYWYASVLSGLQTVVDDASGILNGAIHTIIMGGLAKSGAPKVFKAYGKGMAEALSEFFPMLWNGDMWRSEEFNQEKPETVLEALSESRNLFKKAVGQMKYVRRLKGAIDHLNGLPTQQAAIALMLHRAGMTAELKRMLDPTPEDIRLAREKAEGEGTPPEMMRKRIREILQDTVPDEITLEAQDIRKMVGYKNTPRGVLGGVYHAIAAMEKRVPGTKYLLGTAFARFAANYGNDYLNYMAPVAVYRWIASSGRFADAKHGLKMTPVEREIMAVKAGLGTAAAVAAAAVFLGDDDGKEHEVDITGSFKSLNPDQKNQLLSQGKKPYSIRVGDTYYSYRQLGIGAALGIVGELRDRQLYQPDKWKMETIVDKVGDAMLSGALMVRDSSAIAALMQTVGFANAYKYDVGKLKEKDLPKYMSGLMGSMIPNIARDVDAWSDPALYAPNSGAEYFVRAVPFFRRTVGDGPQLNVLGEEIEVNRYPWSRWVKSKNNDRAWETLGALAAKGVFMPTPEAVKLTMRNGQRRDMTGAELKQYQRQVGKGYRAFIEKEGDKILRLGDPDKMAKEIDRLARPVKRKVLDEMNRKAY